jgi:hypothetical protein
LLFVVWNYGGSPPRTPTARCDGIVCPTHLPACPRRHVTSLGGSFTLGRDDRCRSLEPHNRVEPDERRSSPRPRDAQQKRALLERFDVVRQPLIQSEKTARRQVKCSSFRSHLNVAGEGLD